MIVNKTFDCVVMKVEIQQKALKEKGTSSSQDFYNREREKINHDSVLGEFLKKIKVITG